MEAEKAEGGDVWRKFSHEELEHQYSPSRWSRKYSWKEVIPKHVEEATWRSEEARRMAGKRGDVVYCADLPRGKLDVYGEDLSGASPVLVYVHGGYWQESDKGMSACLVPPLYLAGVVVVVIGYDLAPQVGVEDIVKEVRKGVVWACEFARGRGSAGVVLAGWSAGAQLVTQVLSEERSAGHSEVSSYRDLVRGVVTFSGVFDLRPLVTTYVNDALKLTPESAWALSPLRGVGDLAWVWGGRGRGRGVNVLVVVGQYDSPEFIRQSKQYCQACIGAGLRADYEEVEEADHFSLVSDLFLPDHTLTTRLQTFTHACCKEE